MRLVTDADDQSCVLYPGVSVGSQVFAEDERLAVLPAFLDLLQRAAADGAERGRVSGGRFGRLPLRVQRYGFKADALVGLLAVPVTATASQLRSHIEVRRCLLGSDISCPASVDCCGQAARSCVGVSTAMPVPTACK